MSGTESGGTPHNLSGHDIVTVAEIPGKGRGLVSARRIPKGAVILKEPVIVIADPGEIELIEKRTILTRYLVHWDGRAACLPLGRIALINHSRQERLKNVTTAYDYGGQHIMLLATRDIAPGEELLFDYCVDDRALVEEYGIPTDA